MWQHLNSHAPASTQMTLGNRQDHFFLLVTKVRDRLTKYLATRLRNNFDKGAATFSKSESLLTSLEMSMPAAEDGTSWSRAQSLQLSEGWGADMDTDNLTGWEEYVCAVFECRLKNPGITAPKLTEAKNRYLHRLYNALPAGTVRSRSLYFSTPRIL